MEGIFLKKLGWLKTEEIHYQEGQKIKNGGIGAQSECVLLTFAFLGSNYLTDIYLW